MTAIIISITVGIIFITIFGGLLFNDEKREWGITLFTGFLGLVCIAIPVAYLILKIYK